MMKKMMKPTLFLPFLLLTSIAWGQQRHCDMAVSLLQPTNGAVIQPYQAFTIKAQVKNLGPDTLFSGDTLYYNLPIDLLTSYDIYILNQNIAPGHQASFILDTIVNINDNMKNDSTDFCVTIRSRLDGTGLFIDNNLNNNRPCNAVVFAKNENTGIDDVSDRRRVVKISPNPVRWALNLEIKSTDFSPGLFLIRDIAGRILKKQQRDASNSNFVIPVSNLSPGIYFLDIRGRQRHIVRKFIKQ